MISKWMYVLLGDGDIGKTTFQKRIIWHLWKRKYKRLPSHFCQDLTLLKDIRKPKNIYLIGRSFQEVKANYQDVTDYFNSGDFTPADICVLSCHITGCLTDAEQMILEGKKRGYNLAGVLFSNAQDQADFQDMALLDWDERIWVENPPDSENWQDTIDRQAQEFIQMALKRADVVG